MVAFKSVSTPELATLSQIRLTALSHLTPEVADFLEGGAGDETTLAANSSAFARWGFRQLLSERRQGGGMRCFDMRSQAPTRLHH